MPSMTIELSPATRFDEVQLFNVDAIRLMFGGGSRRGFGGFGGGGQVYQYKLEVSTDGENWTMALDRTGNTEEWA